MTRMFNTLLIWGILFSVGTLSVVHAFVGYDQAIHNIATMGYVIEHHHLP